MLPSECAHRLVSLLTHALEDCTEHQQQLQQKITQCRALLGDWNSQALERPVIKDGKNDQPESELSAKELEELELLNKALEKALRVRTKFLQAPREAVGGTKTADKKPVSSADLNRQAANSKERVSKMVKVTSVSTKQVSNKKPSAYMLKAPYRTDPDVKRPQMKTSTRQSIGASKVSEKRSPKGAINPKAKVHVKITQVDSEKVCATGGHRTLPDSSGSPQNAMPCGGEDSASCRLLLDEVEHSPSDLSTASPMTQSHMAEGTSGTYAVAQPSTLQQKGSLLKLPPPYRAAFSRCARLREKCRLCQTSPDAVATRNSFMEKLQATREREHQRYPSGVARRFCSPPPAFSPAEVKKELMHLRDVHSLLSQCMEAETPASLGENLTWEREYESLLTLEGLQAVVSQCLDKLQQLREAMESHLKLFPADSPCTNECSSVKCAALPSGRCWDAETVGPPRLLYYSSLKELKEMEGLKLQVAILRQQLDIQKAMEAELLPLVDPGHVQEGSRASLYRAIYTLLCEGGERFPVIISDDETSV